MADNTLWYNAPAEEWTSGLPLGNGRLLGVVLGGVECECIQLNEDTLWSGQPVARDKPGGHKHLARARELMFEGRYAEAQRLVEEEMLGLRLAMGMHSYQALGDLRLTFDYPLAVPPASDYRRELSLGDAVASVSYRVADATFTREAFISPVDQTLVVRLSCDKPGRLTFDAGLSRRKAVVEAIAPDRLAMRGIAQGHRMTGWAGVTFETHLHVSVEGGTVGLGDIGKALRVEGADSATLRLVAATSYRGDDPRAVCEEQLASALAKSFDELRSSHVAEHRRLFGRVQLALGTTRDPELPTDERLAAFRNGADDPGLFALYFQFGRYLLISASRPGSMAVNLWGKWVDSLDPAYDADYHININIQMNYWPAEVCNLAECHEPFFDLLDNLRPRGRVTARETYDCRGFVAHYATDAWWYTALNGNPPYAVWPMAPAWCCRHLWDHYLFGGDREYLATRSYPIMKEAAEFLVDYLVEDPRTGCLVTGPSTSPENRFFTPDGEQVSLSMGPAMDMQLVRDLLRNCVEASRILNTDDAFRDQLEEMLPRLAPMQIGDDGRLMEWSGPFEEADPGHRPASHLWGLCAGDQITPAGTPELAEAARKALDVRVANGSAEHPEYRGITAWILMCYARLHDAQEAFKHLRFLLAESCCRNLFAVGERGRERGVFETDVNFGACAAIAEMLLQSHAGQIHLLPALPSAWPEGRVTGLRARGGFEVDIEWEQGTLNAVTVRSILGGECALQYGDRTLLLETEAGQLYRVGPAWFTSVEFCRVLRDISSEGDTS